MKYLYSINVMMKYQFFILVAGILFSNTPIPAYWFGEKRAMLIFMAFVGINVVLAAIAYGYATFQQHRYMKELLKKRNTVQGNCTDRE